MFKEAKPGFNKPEVVTDPIASGDYRFLCHSVLGLQVISLRNPHLGDTVGAW